MADLRKAFGLAPQDVEEQQALRDLYPSRAGVDPHAAGDTTGGELTRGLRSGYYGAVQAAPRAYLGAVQDAAGYKDAAAQSYSNVESLLRRAADSAPQTKWAEVNDPLSFGKYAAGAVGNALSSFAPAVAVGALTRSPALGLASMFPMEAGETAAAMREVPAGQRPDPSAILRASTAKGAVNTAIEAAPFAHLFGKGPLAAISKGVTNPAARFAGRAATQMGAEGGTEYLQEGVGQAAQGYLQPGRDRSQDAEQRAEAFRQGALGALPFAGMAGVSGMVQDGKLLAKSGVDEAKGIMEEMRGKSADEIFQKMTGRDREKRFSMAINGYPTAEEDVVKHGENSLLSKALGKNRKNLEISERELGSAIDKYLRGEGGTTDSKVAAQVEAKLERIFGDRDTVDKVMEYYAAGINATGTLAQNRESVKAEMDAPPSWMDPGGVTSMSQDDLGLDEEGRKAYAAEENGLHDLTDVHSGYHFDGFPGSKRPFANTNAARAGLERVKTKTNFPDGEVISVYQHALETGQDPEETRRELVKFMRDALAKDVAEANKAKTDDARTRAAKRVRDGNDILKKLGTEVVDKDTGEITFDKSVIEALEKIYVVRTEGSADDQKLSPAELRDKKLTAGKGDEKSSLTVVGPDGKERNINVKRLLSAHMARADRVDDAGELVPYRAWMSRSLKSGISSLLNSGFTLKGDIPNDLVVTRSGTTAADLFDAEDRLVERAKEREDAANKAAMTHQDVGGIGGSREGPSGEAGESFDPMANTLRDQQIGGPPQYKEITKTLEPGTDQEEDVTEIGEERETQVPRNFEESVVGNEDVARVGTPWPNRNGTPFESAPAATLPVEPRRTADDAIGTPVEDKIHEARIADGEIAAPLSMNRKAIQARARRQAKKAEAAHAEKVEDVVPPAEDVPLGEPPAWVGEEIGAQPTESGAQPTGLLERVQSSKELPDAEYKALVDEVRGVLKAGELPVEERKALAKALGESGIARKRELPSLESMTEKTKPVNERFQAVQKELFDNAINMTVPEATAAVRKAVRELTSLGIETGGLSRVDDDTLRAVLGRRGPVSFMSHMLDRLGVYAETAKNPEAEKWVRENLNEPMHINDVLTAIKPLLRDQFTKTLVSALSLASLDVTIDKQVLEKKLGVYRPGENTISLKQEFPLLSVLLHEAVHAATVGAAVNNPQAFDALSVLFDHMQKTSKVFKETYGSTNVFEFLSEGLSNPSVRDLLRVTPASEEVKTLLGRVKNMWDAFVRVVRDAIGMKASDENALGQFLDIAGTLIKQTRTDGIRGESNWTEKAVSMSTPVSRRRFAELMQEAPEHVRKAVAMVMDEKRPGKLDVIALEKTLSFPVETMTEEEVATEFQANRTSTLENLVPGELSKEDTSYSHMDDAVSEKLSEEEQQKLRDLIVKQRGDEVKVAFEEALELGPKTWEPFNEEPTSKSRAAGHYIPKNDTQPATIKLAFDVSFATAESTAYHEAMHDFLASLRGPGTTPAMRAAAATIEGLQNNVEVMMQLKELLKNHPDAWAAAQEDPNEAAAYIYQFWVKGEIEIAPAPRNLFEKIFKFFNKVLGVLSNDEKARTLMSSLAAGEFAKPSAVADVINSRKVETFVDKSQRIAGPLFNTLSVLRTSTTDRLRERNIPALREIADLFHKEADQERGRLGYLQKVGQQGAQWRSRLNRVLSGYTEEQIKDALDALQGRKESDSALVRDLRKYMKDIYRYMYEAGVQETVRKQEEVWDAQEKKMVKKTVETTQRIREVKDNYFPRVWDPDAIQRNEAKFLALLMKYGDISENEARGVMASLTSAAQDNVVDETTYTPFLMSARNRRLHWINKANAAEFSEFQKQDLVAIMTDYVAHATKRAESTRSFGHGFSAIDGLLERARREGATAEDIAVAERAVAGMTGSLRHDMSTGVRQFMANMVAYENIVLLPLALMNNLTDIVHISIRSGDLTEGWNAFKTGVREIKNAVLKLPPSEQKRFAEDLGVIDDTVALGAYGDAYEGAYMTGFARKLNDAFFKYNGMQTWNQAMRTAALQAGLRFISRHAMAESNPDSDRYLYELGLTREEAQKLIDKTTGTVAVKRTSIAEALGKTPDSPEVRDMEDRLHEALYRFVDGSALRPNAAHRPIWGSDPYYMLLFHLKQFTFSFQAVTAKFMAKELAYGSVMPVATLMVYAPFALAIQMVRSLLLGRPIDGSLGGIMMALAKSGTMLGTGTFGLDALTDTAKNRIPGISLIGPAPAHGLMALQTLLGADGTSLARLAERSVPLSPIVKAAT